MDAYGAYSFMHGVLDDIDGGDLDAYVQAFRGAERGGMVVLRLYTGSVATADASAIRGWHKEHAK